MTPAPSGSETPKKTIGIDCVASRNAARTGAPKARMTSGAAATNSEAYVSVFPDRVVGSTCALSFSRIARRSLASRPVPLESTALARRTPRADICQSSSQFAGKHLRRCGERPRAHYVFFEDRVRIVDFNERYVIAPEIGQVLKHAPRVRLVQLGPLHYGMAQHQATIAR